MRFVGRVVGLVAMAAALACSPSGEGSQPATSTDALPSWNDSDARQQILNFVARVTDEDGPDFVPEADRIATFDNDGTLWAEQPFNAILEDDRDALSTMGLAELGQLLAATHVGMTAEEFSSIARAWLDSSRHPRFDRPFDTCIYQPMLEVLDYLRANGFQTFIVSAGGIEFMRTFSEKAYSIPRHQVVGTSAETEFRLEGDRSSLMRLPKVAFVDDAEREYAYDRGSKIGGLDRALDEAAIRGWTVVSMRDDWSAVFP